jgi:hypothetical protein
MTAPRDCRPPEDTPDGTVCFLDGHHDVLDLPIRLLATWHTRPWWRGGSYWTLPHIIQFFAPRRMRGYRFHSIAEPPHE